MLSGAVLSQEGQLIPNNSVLSLNSFCNGTSLFCVTNRPFCCDTNRLGSWYPPDYPDPVDNVSNTSSALDQAWGDDQSVRLFGVDSVESGLYRCEVPDRDNVTQILYVGIYSNEEGNQRSYLDKSEEIVWQFDCTSRISTE